MKQNFVDFRLLVIGFQALLLPGKLTEAGVDLPRK
jgi:hypothetical protein